MNVTMLIVSIALVISLASLLIAVGNARRLNIMGVGRPNLILPEALPDGEAVPEVIRDALSAASPESRAGRLLLVVASGNCPACRSLAIDLNHQRARLGALPMVVVDESQSDVAPFAEFLDFETPSVPDAGNKLKEALRVKVIPYSFVISDWRIVGHAVGSDVTTLTRLSAEIGAAERS